MRRTWKSPSLSSSGEMRCFSDSLSGRIGVRIGTTAERYALDLAAGRITKRSESNDELYELLRADEIDAVIDDSPMAKYFSRNVPGLAFDRMLIGTSAEYAIAVRKGNEELRARINHALEAMTRDGTLDRFKAQWID